MKSIQVVAGVVAGVALAIGAATYAQPSGGMGSGSGPGMGSGMAMGMATGMDMGPGHGPMAGQQLMTPDERTALLDKMRSAKTPEERQKLAEATHAEMQKRSQEKGITLPDHGGPGMGFGPGSMTHTH
jgi:hypothetical protein